MLETRRHREAESAQHAAGGLRTDGRRVDARWIAVTSILVWFAVYTRLQPQTFIDESSHLGAIREIARGEYGLHAELPMLPGYHWVVGSIARLTGPSLTLARLVTVAFAIGAVWMYSATRRNLTGSRDNVDLLRFAWLPILFPYTAMAYTDVPAVFFVVGAVWARTRSRYVESAAWMLGAGLVRQTSVIWAAFLAAWVAIELWAELRRERPTGGRPALVDFCGKLAPRVAGYLVVLGGFAAAAVVAGRVQATPVEGQEVRVNVNHLYTVSLLVLVLWAPIWATRIKGDITWLWTWARRFPARAVLAAAAIAVATVLLVATYSIPHPGNRFTGFFLRNEPLLLMDRHFGLRVAGVLLAFAAILLMARLIQSQPNRGPLALASLFSVLFVLPHSLVEPRYYILPFVFTGYFLVFPAREERRLVIWSGFLCVLIAIVIANDWLW